MIPSESFIRSSLFTISAGLVGKVLNFLGSVLIAAYFGADGRTDVIFFVLLLLQSLLPFFTDFNQNILIPNFISLDAEGRNDEAWAMVRFFLLRFGGLTFLLSVLIFLAMDTLLELFTDFPADLRQGSSSGIMLLLPLLFLNYVNDLVINVYQAHKNYSLSNIATFLQGFCLVISVLLWSEYGTAAIAGGFLGGALLQLFYACVLLSRHEVWPKGQCRLKADVSVFGGFAPLVLFFPLTALVYNFAPVYLAAGLEPGTLTAINFARRIYMFIPTLFIYPLVLVLYPRLCEKAVSDRSGLSKSLIEFHNLLLMLVMPMTAFFCVFATEITALAFSYGKYSASALDISARSLRFFAPGAVMLILASITGRAVFSIRNLRTAGLNLLVNVIGALVFPVLLYGLMQRFSYIGIVFGSTIFLFLFHGLVNWGFIYFFIGPFRVLTVCSGYGQNLFFTLSGLLPLLYIQFNYKCSGLFFIALSLIWLLLVQITMHILCHTRTWIVIRSYLLHFRR